MKNKNMKEVNPVKTLDSIDKDKSSDKIIKKLTPKEKSYLLLTKALPPLEKIAKGWPGRQDLQETIQLLKKTLEKNHLNGHTKAFVSILSTLEGIIPLTKQSKDYPLLVKLQRKVLSHNKETNNQETTEKGKKEIPPELTLHALKKIKAYLTPSDIDEWVKNAKKGDRLVYYTGHTFDDKNYNAKRVFDHVRNICFKFEPIVNNKKYINIKKCPGNDWGVRYKGKIDLIQRKVVPEQRDAEKNILSYSVYNYIMEKL
jgi:hypothetical protein|tara:strand:+ start:320 stop:1090 length:771 start_codon:yes stop_codon:yes gene_type:complete